MLKSLMISSLIVCSCVIAALAVRAWREKDIRDWLTATSGWAQLIAVGLAAYYAFGQLTVMRGQLEATEADQRPWISLDMQAEGPLIRDSSGWNFNVKYTLNNVGKSPAFGVDFIAIMVPLGVAQPNPPPPQGFSYGMPTKVVDAAVETACEEQLRLPGYGEIMFPGVPQNKRWKPHSDPVGAGFIPGFAIIGCATYKFVDDTVIHRTVRIFDLEKLAYGQMVDLATEKTATDDLAFFPHPENGSRAN